MSNGSSPLPRRMRVAGALLAAFVLVVPVLLAAGVPGVMTTFSNGQVADAAEVNHNFAVLDGRVDALEAKSAVVAANMVRSEGGTGTGPDATMLTLTLDLTGMAGRWIHVYGGTSIGEPSNTANTSFIRLVIDNGTAQTISAIRQGIGVYSNVAWDGNATASIATQGYFKVTAAYAVPNVTIKLKGGIDAGTFYWGDQPGYTGFDGHQAGGYLGYAIF